MLSSLLKRVLENFLCPNVYWCEDTLASKIRAGFMPQENKAISKILHTLKG